MYNYLQMTRFKIVNANKKFLVSFAERRATNFGYDVPNMTSLIFGVGVGLFILMSVWSVAVFLALVSLRTRHKIGGVAIIAALIVTVILSLIPLDSKTPSHVVHKIYDEVFILRSSLLILLTISSIAGSVSYLVKHLMEPRLAQPLKDKRA